MTRHLSLLLLLSFQFFEGQSQQHLIDSLEKQLSTTLPDTIRAESMMRLAVDYESVDSAKSMQAYKNAIGFSKSRNLVYILGRTYYNQSFILTNGGHYQQAKESLDSALYYLDKSAAPDLQFRKAQVLGELSNVYRYLNDFKKTVEFQMISISILEKIDKPANLLTAYLNLSSFFKEQNEFLKQEEYSRKALALAHTTNQPQNYFKAYMFLALSLNMQNRYKEAKTMLDSSLRYYSPQESYAVLVSYHLIAGLVYLNLGQLDSAYNNYNRSLAIAEKNMAIFSIIQSKLQLGRVFTMQKKFREAKAILTTTSEEIKKYNEQSQWLIALDYLSRLYDESGDYKNALKYYKEYKEISDSVSSDQNKQFASGLEVKYETEKKETQIRELQAEKKIQELTIRQKNNLNLVLIGSALAILLVAVLGYRNYRQKQKLQQQRISELETEKKLTATEAVLKGEEQERTRLAKDLHDGLGGMLSGIKYSMNTMKGNLIMTPDNAQAFERSMEMLDNSIREMRRVAHNMMPEALVKFGLDTALKDFCNDINQSGALKINYQSFGMESGIIDQTTAITVYRIVQELINNTIKHAGAKEAIVQLTRTNGQLAITVEDDGKGFDTALLQRSKGIGWSNIQNRVDFLKGKLDVKAQPNKGTSVLIEINVS